MDARRLILPLLLLALLACGAEAVESSGVVFEGKKYVVSRVDLRREKLELFLRDDAGRHLHRFARLEAWLAEKGRRLVFGMNGGMYHPDFSPVGLFVAEGKELAPLNVQSGEGNFFLKPNGVFLITASGAHVLETSQVPRLHEKAILATQSGPLLLLDGKVHPKFRRGSENKLHRNGVGVRGSQEVVFAISDDPVNFEEFARFFRDQLGCRNALFLDGTVSSLHDAGMKRSDFRMDLGPILGVTAPAAK
jgi:uncharacterized protein YigE (DUF2233 family)